MINLNCHIMIGAWITVILCIGMMIWLWYVTIIKDMLTKKKDYISNIDEIKKIFVKALLENTVPPIKGKITNRKMKWRGIKYAFSDSKTKEEKGLGWLEQRDKRISEKVSTFFWDGQDLNN